MKTKNLIISGNLKLTGTIGWLLKDGQFLMTHEKIKTVNKSCIFKKFRAISAMLEFVSMAKGSGAVHI